MRYLLALLTIACLAALVPAGAGAQEITVGGKGGLNISNLSVDSPDDPDFGFDSQTDFLVGGFVQFSLGQSFAVQPEVLYSQRGAKSRNDDPAIKLNLNYIEIPLLLMARLTSREAPMYPFLYAGPQVSFETRCQVTGEQDGVSLGVDCDAPELDGGLETAKTDFGLVFGGGLEVLYSRLTIQLDARYRLGLTNLNAAEDASEVSVKSRGWSFMLGVGVPIG